MTSQYEAPQSADVTLTAEDLAHARSLYRMCAYISVGMCTLVALAAGVVIWAVGNR